MPAMFLTCMNLRMLMLNYGFKVGYIINYTIHSCLHVILSSKQFYPPNYCLIGFIFECLYKNQSFTFFLYLVPPNATISSLMETSFVADTVSFYCLVEASPPPTIVWLVNGTELDVPAQGSVSLESAGLITLNSSLTLIDIDLDDIGRYSCNATNNLVEVRSDVSEELNLEVLRK